MDLGLTHPSKWWHLALHLFTGKSAACWLQEVAEGVAQAAHGCRQYARVNAIALRKLLDLHDKHLGTQDGRQLLQVGALYCCSQRVPWLRSVLPRHLCNCARQQIPVGCKACRISEVDELNRL